MDCQGLRKEWKRVGILQDAASSPSELVSEGIFKYFMHRNPGIVLVIYKPADWSGVAHSDRPLRVWMDRRVR
jgi:hypothetical protein